LDGFITNESNVQCYIQYIRILWKDITIASKLGAKIYLEDQKNNIKKAVKHDHLTTW